MANFIHLRSKLKGTIVDYLHEVKGLIVLDPIEDVLDLPLLRALDLEGGTVYIRTSDLKEVERGFATPLMDQWRQKNYIYFKSSVSQLVNRYSYNA
ncbi:hypothetical protein phiYS61_28 [Weissella phage phiYS61]|uniref:hypothetical protein n=1 Tax=Weissella phage phiYS61 TaxID=1161906 RepID=UPI000274E243|nr:hypothetical protein phiYS61_28 [Weissella phage phiYS61]AFF27986.1 hypothetical protein phiYS61_28 [Weissella phage phiYS61]